MMPLMRAGKPTANEKVRPMNILVFNCGSSSLKYKLIKCPSEETLAGGEAQRVGPATTERACILHRIGNEEECIEVDMPDHGVAFDEVMHVLNRDSSQQVDAIGHRVVHGGELFTDPIIIDGDIIEALHTTESLAPIHNPPAIRLIEACRERVARLPQVAVFDTAYHCTIPEYARTYALPGWVRCDRCEQGIRKYGFHGTSHQYQYVVEEAARICDIPLANFHAVSCHLGSGGASLCAVRNGCSIDNTMGFSPLQGLVMSTRCGDLDPALPLRYMVEPGRSPESVEKELNKSSGVLGVSGFSSDIREVLAELANQNHISASFAEDDRLALTAQIYLWRLRKYLGAYMAIVGEPRAVILTDTIGETVPVARESICRNMEFFGIRIDPRKNQTKELPVTISTDDSRVRVLAVRTNEELAIARRTLGVLSVGNN